MRLTFTFLSLLPPILAACNLPGDLPAEHLNSPQRQTEIASILHPTELTPQTKDSTPTLHIPELPTSQPPAALQEGMVAYTTQQGDTLSALALRFDVSPEEIKSDTPLTQTGLLPIRLSLQIPDTLEETLPYHTPILPDSEVIYGPTVGDFDAADFAREAGGFLSGYSESVKGQTLTGPEIVNLVAVETSTNPRLLLAFLEYRSGWVFGSPLDANDDPFPIGYGADDKGLHNELMITAKLLAQGFYGWREGRLTELSFYGGGQGRLSPQLNAGSVGLMYLFAKLYSQEVWETQLIDPGDFLAFYQNTFGDYWERSYLVEPYLLATAAQPERRCPSQFARPEA